jgi:hypothetical protein
MATNPDDVLSLVVWLATVVVATNEDTAVVEDEASAVTNLVEDG